MVDPILSLENPPLCLAKLLGSRLGIPWYWVKLIFVAENVIGPMRMLMMFYGGGKTGLAARLQCSGSKAGLNPKPRHAS